MTTFDALETSVESSRPIELYQFTLGADTFRYASTEDDITVGAVVFEAESIARNNVVQGSDNSVRTVMVTLPTANAFASQYVDIVPGQRATMEIFRYQRNESPPFSNFVLMFKGIVQSVRFPNDGHSAEIAVRSLETALNRNVPRFTYMAMCNHFLYDSRCGIDPTLFVFTGTVASVSGNDITVTGAGASSLDFVGGYIRPTAELDFRVVLAQATDVMTLLLPFPGNLVGANVQIQAGCDHLIEGDCKTVFDNIAEFGGFAFVPNRNLFEKGIQV